MEKWEGGDANVGVGAQQLRGRGEGIDNQGLEEQVDVQDEMTPDRRKRRRSP